jgi:hypothetical protein
VLDLNYSSSPWFLPKPELQTLQLCPAIIFFLVVFNNVNRTGHGIHGLDNLIMPGSLGSTIRQVADAATAQVRNKNRKYLFCAAKSKRNHGNFVQWLITSRCSRMERFISPVLDGRFFFFTSSYRFLGVRYDLVD